MTADELARLLKARRTGKGKYVARCPVHPDKNASLAIAEGKKGVVLKCMSQGCDTRAILDVLGLSFKDLFWNIRSVPSDQLKAIYKRRRVEALYERERRVQALKLWLRALECKQKPVRTQTRFERDIELFCRKFSQ